MRLQSENKQLLEELTSLVAKMAYNTATGKERRRFKELEKIILEKMNENFGGE